MSTLYVQQFTRSKYPTFTEQSGQRQVTINHKSTTNQKEQQHSSPWLPNKKGKWQGDIFWAQKNFFCKVYSKSTQQILVKIASMAFHTLFASTKIISQNSLHSVVPEDIFPPTGFFLTLSPPTLKVPT